MNTNIFINRATTQHQDKYDYSFVVYTNSKTKINIICPSHGVFQQTPSAHLFGRGCKKCAMEKLAKNRVLKQTVFVKKATDVHGNKYDYSKTRYLGNLEPITIICKMHGEFRQKPTQHLSGNGCQLCGKEKISESSSYTLKQFITKAENKHLNKYKYPGDDFINCRTKMTIICPDHGEFQQRPNAHLTGQGCRKCAAQSTPIDVTNRENDFIDKAKEIHDNYYLYDKVKYVKASIKVIVICPIHGDFKVTPNNHTSKKSGCLRCKESFGEKFIAEFLTTLNIEFIREYRLPNLHYRHRFDFFLPFYNIIIEYHGIQHYMPIVFFGGEEGLRSTVRRDRFKKSLLRELKIPLLVFNYKQFKHYPEERFKKLILKYIYKYK